MKTAFKQLIALFICITTIFSMLTTAYAGWDSSFGGAGGGGAVGSGYYSEEMQGIRITILAP